jgi:hypothetical protein
LKKEKKKKTKTKTKTTMPPLAVEVAVAPVLDDILAQEAEELVAPLDPQPIYPELNESFGNAIVVTNLPKVSEAKVDKLKKSGNETCYTTWYITNCN